MSMQHGQCDNNLCGNLAIEDKQYFHVRWNLLSCCNYDCSYCMENHDDANCIYVKERVLKIAYKMLATPRPGYLFEFASGEATLYPHLNYLADYLFTAGRNVFACLHSNAGSSLTIYKNFCRYAPPGSIEYVLHIHPAAADLAHVLLLAGMICDNKQRLTLILTQDVSEAQKCRIFARALLALRQKLRFNLKIWRPHGMVYSREDNAWHENVMRKIRFLGQTQLDGDGGAYGVGVGSAYESGYVSGKLEPALRGKAYCCASAHFASISPDGRMSACPYGCGGWTLPLWQDEMLPVPRVMSCRCNCGFAEYVFSSREGAEKHMAQCRQEAKKWRLLYFPVCDPCNGKLNLEHAVLSGLRRLELEGGVGKEDIKSVGNINLLEEYLDEIVEAYGALADEESRTQFLRLLQWARSGNASCLRLVGYEHGCHPDAQHKDEVGNVCGGCFAFLQKDDPISVAYLQKMRKVLRRYKPAFMLALDNNAKETTKIINWLAKEAPGYKLCLGWHGKAGWMLYGRNPEQTSGIAYSANEKLLSLIIIVDAGRHELERTLASLSMAVGDGVEIVLVMDTHDRAAEKIVRRWGKAFVDRFSVVFFDGEEFRKDRLAMATMETRNADLASAKEKMRNVGLAAAKGEYVGFLECGDAVVWKLGEVVAGKIEELHPDVLSFKVAWKDSEGRLLTLMDKEAIAGLDGAALLQEPLEIRGKFYRKTFLQAYNASFLDLGIFSSAAFNLEANLNGNTFFASLDPVVYRIEDREADNNENFLNAFANFSRWLSDICYDFDDDFSQDIIQQFSQKFYMRNRDQLYDKIFNIGKNLNDTENDFGKMLASIAQCKFILYYVINDAASVLAKNGKLSDKGIGIEVVKPDFCRVDPCNCLEYAKGDVCDKEPLLSVIMPNYNKAPYLEECLDSILHQSFTDFELIIIDDASTDESWEVLVEYAREDGRIRLWRMERNSLQGACRNIGIDLARGKWVTFIDSDDMVMPGFFETGVHEMEMRKADIGLFSHKYLQADGQISDGKPLADDELESSAAFIKYAEGSLMPVPWAKMFRLDFILELNLRFPEGIYFEDQFFVAKALRYGMRIFSSSFAAYMSRMSENSSMRPKQGTYRHIHSACKLFSLLEHVESLTRRCVGVDKHLKWNIEKVMLPAWISMRGQDGNVQLLEDDYELLRNNIPFLRNLFVGIANKLNSNGEHDIHNYAGVQLAEASEPRIVMFVMVRNAEACMAQFLESVQQLPILEIEIVVIDCESRDFTGAIVEKYARMDKRISYVRKSGNSDISAYMHNYVTCFEVEYVVVCNGIAWDRDGLFDLFTSFNGEAAFLYSGHTKMRRLGSDEAGYERASGESLIDANSSDYLLNGAYLFTKSAFQNAVRYNRRSNEIEIGQI